MFMKRNQGRLSLSNLFLLTSIFYLLWNVCPDSSVLTKYMDTRDLSKVLSLKLIFLQIGKQLTLLNFILENLIPAHQVSVFFKRIWCLRITGLRVKRKVLSMKVSHSQTSPKLPFFLLSIQRNSPSALPSFVNPPPFDLIFSASSGTSWTPGPGTFQWPCEVWCPPPLDKEALNWEGRRDGPALNKVSTIWRVDVTIKIASVSSGFIAFPQGNPGGGR